MEKVIDDAPLTDDEQESIVSEAGLMPVSQDATYDMQATTQLVPEVRPAEVVARAQEQAEAIMDVVEQKKLYHVIRGKKYLMVEAWQLLAAFNGLSLVVESTERVQHDNVQGWEAKCAVYNADGKKVGAGDAECLDSEKNWKNRDDYMLRSMAQTRSISKACRTILSFVVTLAGYEPTPYDEMSGVFPDDDKSVLIQTIIDLSSQKRIDTFLEKEGKKSLEEVTIARLKKIATQLREA